MHSTQSIQHCLERMKERTGVLSSAAEAYLEYLLNQLTPEQFSRFIKTFQLQEDAPKSANSRRAVRHNEPPYKTQDTIKLVPKKEIAGNLEHPDIVLLVQRGQFWRVNEGAKSSNGHHRHFLTNIPESIPGYKKSQRRKLMYQMWLPKDYEERNLTVEEVIPAHKIYDRKIYGLSKTKEEYQQ